jgi:phospholipase/carboxylesterase
MKDVAKKIMLHYLVRMPKEGSAHPPLLLLLHGYGSNEEDLLDLADELPPQFLILSVRAPRILAKGSYAWFDIDFSSGTPVNDKAQAEESRLILKEFIDGVAKEFSVDAARIYMLGFSQGAIMSYSIALTNPGLIRGVAALSGRILKEIRSGVTREGNEELKIFIGHGTEDTVLRIDFAREAKTYLESIGITPEYHEYGVGHSISKEEIAKLREWFETI